MGKRDLKPLSALLSALVSFVTIISIAKAEPALPKTMSPTIVLKRMTERYASLSSYQDLGAVETTYHEATGARIDKRPFKLFFRRPEFFRVEWVSYYPHPNGQLHVVWSNQQGTFTYWAPDRLEQKASLELGIAGATGISGGAAYTIPTLLMPSIAGWMLTDLRSLELIGDESFEGVLCYHIKGVDQDGDPNEIWIGKQDYLVRKVRSQATFEEIDVSTVQEEIHRNIRINQPIAKETFDFKPPIALGEPKPPLKGNPVP